MADEQAAFSFLGLYEDSTTGGTGGVFDGPFVDTLAITAPGVSFNGPNGLYTTAQLSNINWPPATTRRFFLVGKLAGKAIAGETIHVELTDVNGSTTSPGFKTGMPTNHPADAFTINSARMSVQLSGPVVFNVVDNNAQGANSDGLVVCDFRIRPRNDSWTVASVTFAESGSMDAQADLSFVALYLDDGDGIWEGPATDVLATPSTGTNFNGPDGVYTAGLSAAAGAFTVNQVKRFFLVAKLAGTAGTGETLQVSITAIVQNAPTGGSLTGVPSGATSALMIDQPTLTVNAGPANPTTLTREKSAAGLTEMIGQFRFSARNSAFTVTGMTLTTGGNGDWLNHTAPATGVQVFRDNGNGNFDAGDIKLFEGPGATPVVNCVFTSNQNIAVNADIDLWVVLNLLSSAGASPFETFTAAIESGTDVNTLTAGAVKLGTLAPKTGELRVVDFRVDEFTPTVGLFAGGGAIKIEGSGFALPIVVTIGGIACTGTATVDGSGTLISGLEVPAGTGANLAIILTTNNLPPKTLTQTFRYSSVLPNVNTSGTTTPSSDGCTAAAGPTLALLAPALLGAFAWRRRRK
jgi:MYXO-CTERM domain-containing protein